MKGLSAPKIEGKFSLRASITGEIVMDDVFVPAENQLPNVQGPEGPVRLPQQRALRHRVGRARRRRVLLARGAPVHARPQAVRPAAGRQPARSRRSSPTCRPRSRSGLQGCLRLGRMKDEGKAAPEITSIMKRNSCGKALEIARMARDMHGGNGIVDEFHVIRHMLNLETVNTYEGTHDIHALILGRAQTGHRRRSDRNRADEALRLLPLVRRVPRPHRAQPQGPRAGARRSSTCARAQQRADDYLARQSAGPRAGARHRRRRRCSRSRSRSSSSSTRRIRSRRCCPPTPPAARACARSRWRSRATSIRSTTCACCTT